MRRYIDLNMDMELFLEDSPSKVAEEIKKSGFHGIAISATPQADINNLMPIKEDLRKRKLDVALRVNFEPKSRLELLKFLRRNRRRYEIIGIKPLTNELAIISARDHRVDVIYYDLNNKRVMFRESTAHVCKCALEIQIRQLLLLQSQGNLYKILSRLIKEIEIAVEHDIPIVVASSAKKIWEIRAARDIAALGKCLGLSEEYSLDTISKNPMEIISRNRIKLSRKQVMEGVRLGEM